MSKVSTHGPIRVRTWGPFALFTDPASAAERVSSPVPPPGPMRNLLQALLWKPQMEYRVREIHVLKPIETAEMMLNGVADLVNPRSHRPFYVEDHRLQRYTRFLVDIEYVIVADILVTDPAETPEKYYAQLRRRLRKGQYKRRPCFGCSEFPAFFKEADGSEKPLDISMDLGCMLFDFDREYEVPHFFEAHLEHGILKIPDALYEKWRPIAHATPTATT